MNKKLKAITRPFPENNSRVIYQLSLQRWQSQQQQIDSLDTKIGNVLGFGGALIAILTGFLAITEKQIPSTAYILMLISGGSYIIIIVISLIAYFASKWQAGCDIKEAWQYAREFTEDKLYYWVAESFTQAYENNIDRLKIKINAIRVNVPLFAFQSATLAVGLLLIALK